MDVRRYRAKRKTLPAGEMAEILRDGLSIDELADTLGASPSTIVQRLNEAGWGIDGHPISHASEVADAPTGRIFTHEPWMDEGLCAQTDPEVFFPEKGDSVREAKDVCTRCPVAAECLDFALANNERFGVWGGLSERERRRLTTTNPAA